MLGELPCIIYYRRVCIDDNYRTFIFYLLMVIIYAPQLSWQSARNTMLNKNNILSQNLPGPINRSFATVQYAIYTIKYLLYDNIRVYYYCVVFERHVVIVEPVYTERQSDGFVLLYF